MKSLLKILALLWLVGSFIIACSSCDGGAETDGDGSADEIIDDSSADLPDEGDDNETDGDAEQTPDSEDETEDIQPLPPEDSSEDVGDTEDAEQGGDEESEVQPDGEDGTNSEPPESDGDFDLPEIDF